MDDEIGCYKCPANCECNGYSLLCHVENSLEQISTTDINYIKGLSLKGIQQNMSIQDIMFYGIIDFNASFCAIEKVGVSDQKDDVNLFVIIASFSNNKLTHIGFLVASIFINLVDLDFSFNSLSIISYTEYFILQKLKILILNGNRLKEIIINAAYDDILLSLVDLQYIQQHQYSDIVFSSSLHKQLYVKVSNLLVCCTLQQNIKCTCNKETKTCAGLFNDGITGIHFSIIFIATLCIFFAVVFKHSLEMSSHQLLLKQKGKYYLILSS